jgi:hypothetical protein
MDEQNASAPVQGECLCMGAGPQATAAFRSLSLGGASEHFRNSRIEFLKGLRTMIDSRIEKLQRNAKPRGTSVPVD